MFTGKCQVVFEAHDSSLFNNDVWVPLKSPQTKWINYIHTYGIIAIEINVIEF